LNGRIFQIQGTTVLAFPVADKRHEEQGTEPIRSVVSGSGVATTRVAEKAPSQSVTALLLAL
jgi:hypothetical protein